MKVFRRFSMVRRYVQLGLIHTALAITLVPINGTLNRVMIKELALPATLVVLLASLPYFFSPLQVAIGVFSDRHPLLRRRRSPYILAGLLLCAAGVVAAPRAAFLLGRGVTGWLALLAAGFCFGAWGMGYNLASVSYLALAAELSPEGRKGRTVGIMWFMMIIGIILSSLALSRLLRNYSLDSLLSSFRLLAGVALLIGLTGLAGLEPPERAVREGHPQNRTASWSELLRRAGANRQARRFFVYLLLLLTALLGQDLLLEPFAAEAFSMPVRETTRLTSLWGSCFLLALAAGGRLERYVQKKLLAFAGGGAAMAALLLLAGSGLWQSRPGFYTGLLLLGLGTGLSTTANLSLMLDMTLAGSEGLFMGLWGVANALSRAVGSTAGGLLRDLAGRGTPFIGYLAMFGLLAACLAASLALLSRLEVTLFSRSG